MTIENILKTNTTDFTSNTKSVYQEDFERKLTLYRNAIQNIDKQILELKKDDIFQILPKEADQGEMLANIMLTYRHLEDARMRIGKIFQALDGGKSVYHR